MAHIHDHRTTGASTSHVVTAGDNDTRRELAELTRMFNVSSEEFLGEVRRLSMRQYAYFNATMHRVKDANCPQIFDFLTGGAGVGKSVVIRVLQSAVTRWFNTIPHNDRDKAKVMVAAFTNRAAANVNGITLYAMGSLVVNQQIGLANEHKDLNEVTVARLRNLYSDVNMLVIDEVSMVSNDLFAQLHCRMRQIFDNNLPYDGLHMVAVGDLFQLKPTSG